MINIENIKFNKIKFILVCLLIIVSDDTVLFGTNIDNTFIVFKYTFLIALFSFLLFWEILNKTSFNLQQIFFAFLMFFCIIITAVLNDDYLNGYAYLAFLICVSIVLTRYINFAEFVFYFDKFMFFISCISLITFLIYFLNPTFLSFLPTVTNTANMNFHTVIFSNLIDYTGPLRNFGAFREPGVYQLFLILALLFQIFCFKQVNIRHFIIYCIAILTTFSTTGYFALFLVIICYATMISNMTFKQKSMLLLFMILFFGVISIMLFNDDIFNLVFGKLFMSNSLSYTARMGGIFANLSMWEESPFFGSGLTIVGEQFSAQTFYSLGMGSQDNTNTYLFFLATFGCFFTAIFCWSYYKLICYLTCTKIEKICLILILLIIFAGEKLAFSFVVWILCLYAVDGDYFKTLKY